MADNVTITAGTGTTIAADDIAGVLHQRVKLSQGADGVAVDVSSAAPLQVSLANTGANATAVKVDGSAVTQPVSGTVAISGSVAVTGAFTEYTEDSVADSDPTGLINMLVRADTPATITSTDGDNVAQRGTNYGAAYVQLLDNGNKASIDTTGADNESNTSSRLNVRSHNSVFDGTNWDRMRGDSTDGVLVNLGANNDVTVTGTVTVASHAVTNAGTFAVQNTAATPAGTNNIGDVDVLTLPALPAGTNNIGDVDVLTINGVAPAFGSGVRGATVQRVTIATDDSVPVTIASVPSHAVTNAGTFAVQAAGDIANDAADSGSPQKIGGVATITEQTAVSASGDRVNASFTSTGKQIVQNFSTPEYFVSGAITTAMTATTSTSLVAAPGAGLRNYLTTIIVSNAHATVGTDVIIQDGSGGTTLMTIPAAAVYGGAVITLPIPLRQPTANTAIFCANVTTGASTKVSAVGYKGI